MFTDVTVAILRTEAPRDPHNKELHDLIGEMTLAYEGMEMEAEPAVYFSFAAFAAALAACLNSRTSSSVCLSTTSAIERRAPSSP